VLAALTVAVAVQAATSGNPAAAVPASPAPSTARPPAEAAASDAPGPTPESVPPSFEAFVFPPGGWPGAPSSPPVSGPTTRVATRVAVPALGIDLPVIRQTVGYPPCRVAMYLASLKQPGEGAVTYLYAHAQAGMFLPLLKESLVNDGGRMIGMSVLVWTGDNLRFAYQVNEVRRHITSLSAAMRWKGESVWLQTSEGRGIPQKLQVLTAFVDVVEADPLEAHPVPHPVAC
jgi:hypothetical protein